MPATCRVSILLSHGHPSEQRAVTIMPQCFRVGVGEPQSMERRNWCRKTDEAGTETRRGQEQSVQPRADGRWLRMEDGGWSVTLEASSAKVEQAQMPPQGVWTWP